MKTEFVDIGINQDDDLELRENNARTLTDWYINHKKFFDTPDDRLNLLGSIRAADFFQMTQHANATLRGKSVEEVKSEVGAVLPMLHVPPPENKQASFERGFTALQEYLSDSSDSIEEKILGSSLALEGLIVLTHPFNDGNGRTARFFGSLIENGIKNTEQLISETVSRNVRLTDFSSLRMAVPVRQSYLATANDPDILLDDEERQEMRQQADKLPDDIQGMYLVIKKLLEDQSWQDEVTRDRG